MYGRSRIVSCFEDTLGARLEKEGLIFFFLVVIVGSLSGSRLKSVRFLVGESDALVASGALAKIIKINH